MSIIIKTLWGRELFTAPNAASVSEAVIAARKAGADLRGADLRGADLRGADLRGADLRGADLGGSKEKPEHVISALKGSAKRSDGYEFHWFATEDGEVIRAGCRTFTLKEFKAHVANSYPGTKKAKETLRILAFLKAQSTQKSWS